VTYIELQVWRADASDGDSRVWQQGVDSLWIWVFYRIGGMRGAEQSLEHGRRRGLPGENIGTRRGTTNVQSFKTTHARSNYCAMCLRNKRTRQWTRSTSQTTQGQATNAFGKVATMDDGVGGSVTRQRWLTSSQQRAQGARDRARRNGQGQARQKRARAGEQGRTEANPDEHSVDKNTVCSHG
jgi:hypothetical protein